MPISRKTPNSSIKAHLDKVLRKEEAKIIRKLQYAGELCLIEARTNGAYVDDTGNLRSSVGYVVLNNGEVVTKAGFQGTDKGSSKGNQFIDSLISSRRSGYVLIVVAGMNYASHVEAKGKNVLTSAEQLAINKVPKMLKRLGLK